MYTVTTMGNRTAHPPKNLRDTQLDSTECSACMYTKEPVSCRDQIFFTAYLLKPLWPTKNSMCHPVSMIFLWLMSIGTGDHTSRVVVCRTGLALGVPFRPCSASLSSSASASCSSTFSTLTGALSERLTPPLSTRACDPSERNMGELLPEPVLCKSVAGLEGLLGERFLSSMQPSRASQASR